MTDETRLAEMRDAIAEYPDEAGGLDYLIPNGVGDIRFLLRLLDAQAREIAELRVEEATMRKAFEDADAHIDELEARLAEVTARSPHMCRDDTAAKSEPSP